MGCYETVGLGIPKPCTATGCCVLSGEHTFSEEQEEMFVDTLRWRSRCVEVTQRAVLPAEEELQRETASDTPGEGGVAVRITVKHQPE